LASLKGQLSYRLRGVSGDGGRPGRAGEAVIDVDGVPSHH
jgi:hypothetical protein